MFQNLKKPFLFGGVCCFIILIFCIRFHPTSKAVILDFITPYLVKKKNWEWKLEKNSTMEKSKIELVRHIETLNQKIEILQLENRRLHKLKQTNKDLNRLLTIEGSPDYDYLPARIISKDPANGGRKIRIDRGIMDGVRIGQPVLAKGFLYGRILESSNHASLVLTLLDPNCKISVKISDTSLHGILFGLEREAWKINSRCIIRYLPRDFDYKEHMKVETSGHSLMIPGSIPVGTLVANKRGKVTNIVDQLYKTANVTPLDFTQEFDYVTILMKRE